MRTRTTTLALGLLAAAALLAAPRARAGEKKEGAKELKVEGKLTKDDALDKVRQNSYHKAHTFQMAEGKTYRIDLTSTAFDSYLRLEGPDGKQVAQDDDSGGFPHARILYAAPKAGEYRIIVTTFAPRKEGGYVLTAAEATGADVLLAKARNIGAVPAAERKQILEDLKKHFEAQKDRLTIEDAQLAFMVGSSLEGSDKAAAEEAYRTFGKVLAASRDAKVGQVGRMLEGAGRRVGLMGKTMDLKGKTVDGKELDWKSYRGKVVLVDFWATWCPPCIKEIPNIKKAHETYHKRGFDVIGISLDHDRSALERFIEREKLPWKSIHEDLPRGEMQPLAVYYGILSIPQAILLDREGRVVSMNARGQELDRLLEKHIGPEKSGEK